MTFRILFIDAYDSFTNNIVSLLETSLNVEVTVIKLDCDIPNLPLLLRSFSAVIAGPGPGNPVNSADVGLIQELWKLEDRDILPVLGICLGFQSLVLAFGGTIQPLPSPRHGIETRVCCRKPQSNDETIFGDIHQLVSVQYHSLHASLGHQSKDDPDQIKHYWEPTSSCPDLEPLAWDISTDEANEDTLKGKFRNPSHILMAVKHRYKPFFGIQFHPESICSDADAQNVIRLWWNTVTNWHRVQKHVPLAKSPQASLSSVSKDHELEEKVALLRPLRSLCDTPAIGTIDTTRTYSSIGSLSTTVSPTTISPATVSPSTVWSLNSPWSPLSLAFMNVDEETLSITIEQKSSSLWNLTVPIICDVLDLVKNEVIVLDSEAEALRMPELATYSIVGIVTSQTLRLEYSIGSRYVLLIQDGMTTAEDLQSHGGTIFSYIKRFMRARKVTCPHTDVPFWGGLMGYINYEACLETIDVCSKAKHSDRPDLSFAFVERSIVINHERRLFYVQSIKSQDSAWVANTYDTLVHHSKIHVFLMNFSESWKQMPTTVKNYLSSEIGIQVPVESSYKAKIRACQDFISAGDSYELCLTNQVSVRVKSRLSSTSWPLYLRLRHLNPAPFAAYVRLGSLTLLSTSPERFMCWSRPLQRDGSHSTSVCQFRPIKGTVSKARKTSTGELHILDLAEATSLLSTTKERAENLMIVDLIRHDLHGVVGSGNVSVEKLMVVEEYHSVFQLVSVIKGRLESSSSPLGVLRNSAIEEKGQQKIKTGIDVLAASLPPGSMTGAPKRRSCELLQTIEEHQPRSIYSGVLGYMCVGGRGDFSVVIRSMFKWDSSGSQEEGREETGGEDEWHISAGGAVTILSSEDGEWEEMKLKLMSTMKLFRQT